MGPPIGCGCLVCGSINSQCFLATPPREGESIESISKHSIHAPGRVKLEPYQAQHPSNITAIGIGFGCSLRKVKPLSYSVSAERVAQGFLNLYKRTSDSGRRVGFRRHARSLRKYSPSWCDHPSRNACGARKLSLGKSRTWSPAAVRLR